MGAKKYDSGKLRMDLVPKEAVDALAEVLGFGAEKYGDHNWRNGLAHSRSYAALQRHLTAYWAGETFDPESGLSHLKHAIANLAFMLALPDQDDRYKKKEEEHVHHYSVRFGDDEDSCHGYTGDRENPLPCSEMRRKQGALLCRRTDCICLYTGDLTECHFYSGS